MSEATPAPANRVVAERIITRFYARLGRPQPSFIWFDDPIACVLTCDLFERLRQNPDWFIRKGTTYAPLAFKHPIGGQVPRRIWLQLEGALREVTANLPSPVPGDRLAHVAGFWGGAIAGLQTPDARPGPAAVRLNELQRACGWWSPRESAVICSDGPREFRVDATGRLHAERGPACELSRQHKVYAWHGVRVPPEWIEHRDRLVPSIALAWPNLAEQRAALEIVGWANVITHLPQRVIDTDRDPHIGTLLECEVPGLGPSRFLRVRCGTGRDFVLSVPVSMTTALQANAWTYGLQGNEYQLEARS